MEAETITRGSQGTMPQRTRRSRLGALRHRAEHRSAPPAAAAVTEHEPATGMELKLVTAAPEPEETVDEFVWTPAKRVNVLAVIVWVHQQNTTDPAERDEVKFTHHGLSNAIRAGLVCNEDRNWTLTPRGLEELRAHNLLETYSVTPVAI